MMKTQWISVSERLPEKSGKYLLWRNAPYEDKAHYFIGNYDADVEDFGEWQEKYAPITFGYLDSDFIDYGEVLAWMPLPEPYTEVK